MKIVEQSYEILSPIDADYIYKQIEKAARTCYKSEDKIKEGSAEKMVRALVRNRHEAMLEHASITIKFITDRAIANEIVRHRLCSYAQESSRYCCYKDGVEFIEPILNHGEEHDQAFLEWSSLCSYAENAYINMIASGCTPEEARSVLPLSTKTEIVVTANLRELRHIFDLRVLGITGKPHPQIVQLMAPLLKELAENLPLIFGDQYEVYKERIAKD